MHALPAAAGSPSDVMSLELAHDGNCQPPKLLSRDQEQAGNRGHCPVIEQLRQGWQKPKDEELERLLNKLPELDERAREEIRRSFDRLLNKLLHPPLESLRDEARERVPRGLLDALAKLFRLKD